MICDRSSSSGSRCRAAATSACFETTISSRIVIILFYDHSGHAPSCDMVRMDVNASQFADSQAIKNQDSAASFFYFNSRVAFHDERGPMVVRPSQWRWSEATQRTF